MINFVQKNKYKGKIKLINIYHSNLLNSIMTKGIVSDFHQSISLKTLKFKNSFLEEEYMAVKRKSLLKNAKMILPINLIMPLYVVLGAYLTLKDNHTIGVLIFTLGFACPSLFLAFFDHYNAKYNILPIIRGCFLILLNGIFTAEFNFIFEPPFSFMIVFTLMNFCMLVQVLKSCSNWIIGICCFNICHIYTLIRSATRSYEKDNKFSPTGFIPILTFSLLIIISTFLAYSGEYVARESFFAIQKNKEEKKQFKEIMELLPVGILISRKKDIHYFNSALLSILKIKEEDMKYSKDLAIQNICNSKIFEEDRSEVAHNSLGNLVFSYSEPKEVIVENRQPRYSMLQKNSTRISHFECKFLPISFWNEDCLCTVIKDQTEFRELEEERIAKKHQKMFFFTITHELRTPLNGIVGISEVLEKTETNKNLKEKIKVIKSNSLILLNLIHDILDLSQIDSGSFKIINSKFNIQFVINEVIEIVDFQAKKQGIEIKYIRDPSVPKTINADQHRYRQILINLVGNAIKFTRIGFIRINIFYQFHNSCLVTEVEDTGIGIKEEDQKVLFKDFSKITSTQHLNSQGVGLGLSIAKQLVERMGGSINCTSEYKKGTTFRFSIQDNIEEKALLLTESTKNRRTRFGDKSIHTQSMEQKKEKIEKRRKSSFIMLEIPRTACNCNQILIIDDNSFNRFALQSQLRLLKYEADESNDGAEGIDLMKRSFQRTCCSSFHLLFVDINMPEMNGYETTEKIRKLEEEMNIPASKSIIVGLSAFVDNNVKEKCFSSGMDLVMEKPLRLEDLQNLLHKFLY